MEKEQNLLPFRTSPLTIIYKTAAGVVGGLIGSGLILLIFTIASSVISPVLKNEIEGEIAPVFVIVFLIMIFLGTLAASLVSVFLMGLSEKTKYNRLATTMFQVFLLNLVVFLFTAPIYVIVSNFDLSNMALIAAMQVLLSSMASSTILEMVSNSRYGLIGVYTSVLGTLIALIVISVLYNILQNQFVVMFGTLPVLWSAIGFANSFLNISYFQLYKLYGIDFLSSQQSFGSDLAEEQGPEEISEEEIYEATTKDEAGSDFLKK